MHEQAVDAHGERPVGAERERERDEGGRGDRHREQLLRPADERVEHDRAERDRGRGERTPCRPLQPGACGLGAGPPAPRDVAR